MYRDDTRVFENLSLTIERGENTALIGPNGAGKSTLIKLLTREVYPVVAENSYIRILGQDRPVLWDLRREIGLVSQDLQNQYRNNVPGRDIVLSGFFGSVGLYDHNHPDDGQLAHAENIMQQLDILPLAGRTYSAMSTGQQRRFLLARALIHRPHSLVLDEPTSGLDLHATFQYLELVRNFMREDGTVVLVTHHIHEIPPEINRVVLLVDGRIVADGSKDEILTDDQMSRTFNTAVHVVKANGYFQAVPGSPAPGRAG